MPLSYVTKGGRVAAARSVEGLLLRGGIHTWKGAWALAEVIERSVAHLRASLAALLVDARYEKPSLS